MPLVFLLSKYQFYLPTPLMITGYVYHQTRLFMHKLKRWRSGIAENWHGEARLKMITV